MRQPQRCGPLHAHIDVNRRIVIAPCRQYPHSGADRCRPVLRQPRGVLNSHPGFYYKIITTQVMVRKARAWSIKHGLGHIDFRMHEKTPIPSGMGASSNSIRSPSGDRSARISRRNRTPRASCRGRPRRSRRPRSAAPWWPGRRGARRRCPRHWPRSSCRTAGRRSSRFRC